MTMPKRPVRKSDEEIEVKPADMKILGASRCDYVSKWRRNKIQFLRENSQWLGAFKPTIF